MENSASLNMMKPYGMRQFDSVTKLNISQAVLKVPEMAEFTFRKRVIYDHRNELSRHLCSSVMNHGRAKSERLWGLVLCGILRLLLSPTLV